MKRILTIVTALIMTMGMTCSIAMADSTKTADVYVTISNAGQLEMTYEKVTATDLNNDGKIDIDETLKAAHDVAYEGGAAAGYGSVVGSWGLSLTKLWGDESGSFGYFVNNASAWSLSDEVKNGDIVHAYIYSDKETWSDVYSWFDKPTVTTSAGEEFSLTLNQMGYDPEWNPLTVPIENAWITVEGEQTEAKTDVNGNVTMSLDQAGTYVISAVLEAESPMLVPPVCIVTVEEKAAATEPSEEPEDEATIDFGDEEETTVSEDGDANQSDGTVQTGDDFHITFYALLALAAVIVMTAVCVRRKRAE